MQLLIIAFLALSLGANCANPRLEGNLRLIQFNETTQVWMTPEQVIKMAESKAWPKFIDITDFRNLGDGSRNQFVGDVPVKPGFEAVVRPLLTRLNEEQIVAQISRLSAFPTRRYNTQTGEEAVDYLVAEYKKHSSHRSDVSVEKFKNTFVQSSIIARIQGEGPNADELVIIGGHVDSISSGSTAPGADDDASGSSTVLEIFRVLANSDFKPKRTIEFHGYAGEEGGLLGSQAIASAYKSEGKVIAGMLQLDMTGKRREIFFLVGEISYSPKTDLPWADTRCGYGCSDHASWYKAGYRASFPFEGLFSNSNPRIHTASDLLQYLNPAHMLEFSKLGLSFVVEMSLAP